MSKLHAKIVHVKYLQKTSCKRNRRSKRKVFDITKLEAVILCRYTAKFVFTKLQLALITTNVITSDSILCSDGVNVYKSIAKENGLTHYRSIASRKERVIGKQFHIQNVNNYTMRMRKSLSRFSGVGLHIFRIIWVGIH